jgi:hypothetical protein
MIFKKPDKKTQGLEGSQEQSEKNVDNLVKFALAKNMPNAVFKKILEKING